MSIHAILLAGGQGTRMGGAPKQFRSLGGQAVVDWSLRALIDHPRVTGVVVVGDAPAGTRASACPKASAGATRRASVASGLAVIPDTATHVMIHDAARPGLEPAMIDALVAALDASPDAGAIIPVLPVADTLIAADGIIVDRSTLARVQTPQLCEAVRLRAAHRRAWPNEPTDDAQMVAAEGGTIVRVTGSERLHKLTDAGDWDRVERMLMTSQSDAAGPVAEAAVPRRLAVGTGYDVHALVPGDHVWLCGVRVPHDRALSGHSDADVGLHALTDAILGALGAGDIGSHFPPSDLRWLGAASDQFLAHAMSLMRAAGGRLHHVDVTLICEAPKVGPHRDAMRARIAAICGLSVSQVGVKATTSEQLGFTGRREGIAAQAVASADLPWPVPDDHQQGQATP